MNPDALVVANVRGYTPFENAISWVNDWAIEHFQWKLSIWSVEEAFVKVIRTSCGMNEVKVLRQREQRFREVVQGV